MNEITIVAFNYGNAGRYVNGPGMCLLNFVKKLRQTGLKVNVFTKMKSNFSGTRPISNNIELKKAISVSRILHHWSGIGPEFINAIKLANQSKTKILIGPNALDTVNFKQESAFLSQIDYDRILTVNERLRFRLSKTHMINLNKIDILMVGPDPELWSPISENDNTILWKGNSRQIVKDVGFALKLEKSLPQYKFKFIGYPKPYNYFNHIIDAKKSKLLINTSLSETMGLAMAEAWMSGVPSVSHPEIYLYGVNYKTGIISNRTIDNYRDVIIEIMEDNQLYKNLSLGCREYILENLNNRTIAAKYLENYL